MYFALQVMQKSFSIHFFCRFFLLFAPVFFFIPGKNLNKNFISHLKYYAKSNLLFSTFAFAQEKIKY